VDHDVRELGTDHLSHQIAVEPGTILARTVGPGELGVNSFHHQAVWDLPEGFIASAKSPDGVIEGIESPSHRFAVGVQCHPEGMCLTTGQCFNGLFRAFVEASQQSSAADGGSRSQPVKVDDRVSA